MKGEPKCKIKEGERGAVYAPVRSSTRARACVSLASLRLYNVDT